MQTDLSEINAFPGVSDRNFNNKKQNQKPHIIWLQEPSVSLQHLETN